MITYFITYSSLILGSLLFYNDFVSSDLFVPNARGRWDRSSENCTRVVRSCTPIPILVNRTCLGTTLPYERTVETFNPIPFQPTLWELIKVLPSCWDKLHLFLCSIYFPECFNSNTGTNHHTAPLSVSLHVPSSRSIQHVVEPDAEMCKAVHQACPFLNNRVESPLVKLPNIFGDLLNCSLYPSGCRRNKLTPRILQKSTGQCSAPLVKSQHSKSWLRGIAGCSFQCRQPHLAPGVYQLARWLTGSFSIICLLLNILVLVKLHFQSRDRRCLLTELTHEPDALSDAVNRTIRPTRTLSDCDSLPKGAAEDNVVIKSPTSKTLKQPQFHSAMVNLHVYCLLACLGWLMPILPGIGDSIACRKDGSLRSGGLTQLGGSKNSSSSLLCIINHCIVYFATGQSLVWSIILYYALNSHVSRICHRLFPADRRQGHSRSPSPPADSYNVLPNQLNANAGVGNGDTCQTSTHPSLMTELIKANLSCNHPRLFDNNHLPQQPNQTVPSNSHSDKSRLLNTGEDGKRLVTSERKRPHRHEQRRSHSQHSTCLHLLSFAITLALSLITLTTAEIDGDALSGLCFVGHHNLWARLGLVILPFSVCLLIQLYFLFAMVGKFRRLARRFAQSSFQCDVDMSRRLAKRRYYHVFYAIVLCGIWLFSLTVQLYVHFGEPKWLESQRLLYICQLKRRLLGLETPAAVSINSFGQDCLLTSDDQSPPTTYASNQTLIDSQHLPTSHQQPSQPRPGPLLLHLITFFLFNLLQLSFGLFTRSSETGWRWRKMHRLCFPGLRSNRCLRNRSVPVQAYLSHCSSVGSSLSWWDPGLFSLPPAPAHLPLMKRSSVNVSTNNRDEADPKSTKNLDNESLQLPPNLIDLLSGQQQSDDAIPPPASVNALIECLDRQLIQSAQRLATNAASSTSSLTAVDRRDQRQQLLVDALTRLFQQQTATGSSISLRDATHRRSRSSIASCAKHRRSRHFRLSQSHLAGGHHRSRRQRLSSSRCRSTTNLSSNSFHSRLASSTSPHSILQAVALSVASRLQMSRPGSELSTNAVSVAADRASTSRISSASAFSIDSIVASNDSKMRHQSIPRHDHHDAGSNCSTSVASNSVCTAPPAQRHRRRIKHRRHSSTRRHSMRSRSSLSTSISSSLTSSSALSGQSYNSWRLLMSSTANNGNCATARWQEAVRTRLLLAEVLRWVEQEVNNSSEPPAPEGDNVALGQLIETLIGSSRQQSQASNDQSTVMATAFAVAAAAAASVLAQQQAPSATTQNSQAPFEYQIAPPPASRLITNNNTPPSPHQQNNLPSTIPTIHHQPPINIVHHQAVASPYLQSPSGHPAYSPQCCSSGGPSSCYQLPINHSYDHRPDLLTNHIISFTQQQNSPLAFKSDHHRSPVDGHHGFYYQPLLIPPQSPPTNVGHYAAEVIGRRRPTNTPPITFAPTIDERQHYLATQVAQPTQWPSSPSTSCNAWNMVEVVNRSPDFMATHPIAPSNQWPPSSSTSGNEWYTGAAKDRSPTEAPAAIDQSTGKMSSTPTTNSNDSDAFDSEDDIISSSSSNDNKDIKLLSFPPSCLEDDDIGPDGDDFSDVSRSASQIVNRSEK